MRSILLALAFIAPTAAFAAAPPADYTNPIVKVHTATPQQVLLTFQNNTTQDRILVVEGRQFRLHPGQLVSTPASVGAIVRMYCPQNSKINGQPLLQVAPTDAHHFITIS